MEGGGKAEQWAGQTIERILEQAFLEVKTRRLNHILAHEMPEDYLQYISHVSMMLHAHRHPAATRTHKTITEPCEPDSHQLHHPHHPHPHIPQAAQQPQPHPEQTGIARKPSFCLSHRSRQSEQRLPSRRAINSRRKLFEGSKLIALGKPRQEGQVEAGYEEKITQLRKRKVKLEEAMRAFREEERPEPKRNRENTAPFTTDYRGKVVAFNPRVAKARLGEGVVVGRVETLVESGRSWGNWGKVSSSTRRNLFRETGNERGCSQADL